MSAEGRPLAVLTEESEQQLQRLRRGLKRAAGFAFYVVVARDMGRVEVLRRLRAWSGVGGVPVLRFFPEGVEGVRAVEAFLAAKDEEHTLGGAVIADGGALIDVEEGNALAALNVARDVLDKMIRGPLLLVLSPEREGDLARRAPDLFDVRAGTVTVEAGAVEAGAVDVETLGRRDKGGARSVAELQVEAVRLRALAESEDPPLGALVDAWVRLGGKFLKQGEIGEAREAAKRAQRLAELGGYRSGVAKGMALEGDVLAYMGELDKAQDWYEKSLAMKEELRDRRGMAVSYHQLGMVVQDRGELDKAQDWYEKSLAIKEELGNRHGMASTYHQLGWVAHLRGEVDKAQDLYERSLAIKEELGNRPGMASTYHHLAMVAHDRGGLDKAQTWYEKSLAIKEELGNRPGMAITYHQLGIVAQDRGKLDKAQAWYEKSLAITESLGTRPGMAVTYLALGILAEHRNDAPQALYWMVRAVALFPDFPHRMTRTAPEDLARLTAALGLPALEASWQRVTGEPLPAAVRAYVDRALGEQAGPGAPSRHPGVQ